MIRPVWHVRILLAWAFCCLAGVGAATARADPPALTAVFGIAGRYRPGAWCPVTVTVHNPSTDSVAGQVQALAGADANRGGMGGSRTLGEALFARPVTVSSGLGPQSFQLYTRGLDPGRDSVTVQLVEGRQRGDGRALAKANTQDSNTTQDITGTPVGDNDPFLVGFGGDPGVFSSLERAAARRRPCGRARGRVRQSAPAWIALADRLCAYLGAGGRRRGGRPSR